MKYKTWWIYSAINTIIDGVDAIKFGKYAPPYIIISPLSAR